MRAGPWVPHRRGLICSGFPESLVRDLLGARDWPPALGEACREMKAGSLQRLPEPVPDEMGSSLREGSSLSKEREEEEEEEEEDEKAAFLDKGEAEANPRGEGGGEAGGTVLEVGELDIFLA